VWTDKARTRFKERIQAITSRSRGVSTYCMLSELRRYVVGWLNYFGISAAYREIPAMDQWLRRRVRLYYWKQWKRARGRRRNLIRLGIHPAARFSILPSAFCVPPSGVPSIRQQWIEMHYGPRNDHFNPEAVNLTGTAGCGPACPVVWEVGG